MDIITYTEQWIKGEVLQGKIMFAIGIVVLALFLYVANFQDAFYKGMILPVGLLLLVLLGYGGFQITMRPKHINNVTTLSETNPKLALGQELEKAKKDDKSYSLLKPIWIVLFIASSILFFVISSSFWKGMSFGFALWFLTAFVFDMFLHHRLKVYLDALLSLAKY